MYYRNSMLIVFDLGQPWGAGLGQTWLSPDKISFGLGGGWMKGVFEAMRFVIFPRMLEPLDVFRHGQKPAL
jgi:hypothetical protein